MESIVTQLKKINCKARWGLFLVPLLLTNLNNPMAATGQGEQENNPENATRQEEPAEGQQDIPNVTGTRTSRPVNVRHMDLNFQMICPTPHQSFSQRILSEFTSGMFLGVKEIGALVVIGTAKLIIPLIYSVILRNTPTNQMKQEIKKVDAMSNLLEKQIETKRKIVETLSKQYEQSHQTCKTPQEKAQCDELRKKLDFARQEYSDGAVLYLALTSQQVQISEPNTNESKKEKKTPLQSAAPAA